ncbi:hypothetical protein PINS_up023229 [Pythium insidiosum]|nr:hypothetical protein PINS_up023229 [Pythium insidiosum]
MYEALDSPHAASDDRKHPLESAGWLSQLTLWWLNPAMRLGYQKRITEDDVWHLPLSDRSEVLQDAFDRRYAAERLRFGTQSPVSILRPLWHSTKRTMVVAILLHVVSAVATLLQPLLIKSLLQLFQGDAPMIPIHSGYAQAALLTATAFAGVTAMDFGSFLTTRCGLNARTIAINAVFQKLLRLSTRARQTISSGDVLTLAGVDSERLSEAYAISIWALLSPIMIAGVCVLIGVEMGAVVGLVAAACCALILVYALSNAREIGRQRRAILQVAGERVQLTNEALQGIRAIKLYAWEPATLARVHAVRERELRLIRRYDALRVRNLVVLSVAQTLVTAACLVVYVFYERQPLTVPTAFVLLALTNACRMPFGIFSNAVVFAAEALGSAQRIGVFLSADELSMPALLHGNEDEEQTQTTTPSTAVVELQNAAFAWTQPSDGVEKSDVETMTPTLHGLSLSIERGSLTIVVGAVGSGKSSLLSALLGEMPQLSGRRVVQTTGAIAFASQQPWLQHGSVRENVLFGAAFDAAFYSAVLSACQLPRDLEGARARRRHRDRRARTHAQRWSEGAREPRARALYRRDAELLLLDDPLSALDPHVANAVFTDAVLRLAGSKTRVLTLNAHYHLLPHADRVVVLENGAIVADGPFDAVCTAFPHLRDAVSGPSVPHDDERQQAGAGVRPSLETETPSSADTSKATNPKRALMIEEERAVGGITWWTYAAFLQLSTGSNSNDSSPSRVPGAVLGVAVLLAFAVAQGGVVAGDYVLTFWSEGSLSLSQRAALGVFLGVVAVSTLLLLARAVLYTEICVRAVATLHATALYRVLHAHVTTFFDVTPVGRLLNRFSRDLDQLDNPLPYYSLAMLMFLMLLLAALVVCAVATPPALALYPVLGAACVVVQRFYLATSRELKRWDGVTRSPFVALVAETTNGLESIRAFRETAAFGARARALLDHNAKFALLFQASAKWYALRLDWLVTSVVACVAFTSVAMQHVVGAATAGIALTYAVQLSLPFQRFLAFASATENYMTSYERLAHYTTLKDEEDDDDDEEDEHGTIEINTTPPLELERTLQSWPTRGAIEFQNVTAAYRKGLAPVLRDVSFSVRGGEAIGVCGRTGSGKSTLPERALPHARAACRRSHPHRRRRHRACAAACAAKAADGHSARPRAAERHTARQPGRARRTLGRGAAGGAAPRTTA